MVDITSSQFTSESRGDTEAQSGRNCDERHTSVSSRPPRKRIETGSHLKKSMPINRSDGGTRKQSARPTHQNPEPSSTGPPRATPIDLEALTYYPFRGDGTTSSSQDRSHDAAKPDKTPVRTDSERTKPRERMAMNGIAQLRRRKLHRWQWPRMTSINRRPLNRAGKSASISVVKFLRDFLERQISVITPSPILYEANCVQIFDPFEHGFK